MTLRGIAHHETGKRSAGIGHIHIRREGCGRFHAQPLFFTTPARVEEQVLVVHREYKGGDVLYRSRSCCYGDGRYALQRIRHGGRSAAAPAEQTQANYAHRQQQDHLQAPPLLQAQEADIVILLFVK
jgi:hypothetical protein